MSGFQLLASLVDSLAWPVAAVVAALFLRRHLAALFRSVEQGRQLRRAKVGPVEVEWEPVIEQVLYNVSAATAASMPPTPIRPGVKDNAIAGGLIPPIPPGSDPANPFPSPRPPAPATDRPPASPPPVCPAPAAEEDEEAAEPAADWEEWMQAEQQRVVTDPRPSAAPPRPTPPKTSDALWDLLVLADSQPAAAVIVAFTRLETTVLALLRGRGVITDSEDTTDFAGLLRKAVFLNVMSSELAESIRGLRDLRDVASDEEKRHLVTTGRATQYVAATKAVLAVVTSPLPFL